MLDGADVMERILSHLKVWDLLPDPIPPAGPDPPWPKGETLPLTYHPLPDIACAPVPMRALGQATSKTAEFMSPRNDRARVTSRPLLLRMMQSPVPRRPVSRQGFEAVSTRAWPRRRDTISYPLSFGLLLPVV